ncbi:MAG: four helix bundle protein [candidate division NC10 bacterium]|nr:four helix bundle protein [candidate division NC10 bacterium]
MTLYGGTESKEWITDNWIGAPRTGPITDFTDLECWQLARKLRHEVYRITRTFPKSEEFNLVKQLRAASVSATSNIAEGFGRYH